MYKMLRVVSLVAIAILVLGLPASADVVTFSAVSGTWTATTGGVPVNGIGTNEVRWGIPAGGTQSGLRFDGAATPLNVTTGTIFELGTLTHFNQPIQGGTAASQAFLDVNVTNGGPHTFSFTFGIDETPNVLPCAYPSVTPCADAIFFPSSGSFSAQAITIGGTDYHLQILGFGASPGSFTDSFISQEGGNNTTNLYAELTVDPVPSVPEPASLVLFGSGAVALFGTLRRKLRK